ncbi:MAG: S8 family serine peptidase [Nostocaceae cyanobacterium]|nr:S8 family serine peptidase [Nostocaceae cyanobacterium]
MQEDIAGNTLGTAEGLNISSSWKSVTGNINSLDGDDFYRVHLGSSSALYLYLDELSENADIKLIQDSNSNGEVDSGEVIVSSQLDGTTPEYIGRNVNAGTYYIGVDSPSQIGTNYRLSVMARPYDYAGNSLSQARNITSDIINGSSAYSDWVGSWSGNDDTNDYYRFNISDSSELTLNLSGLSSDVDVQLIHDVNDNQVVDIGEVIASSVNTGNTNESITSTLNSGSYYARVYSHNGAQSYYNLDLSAISIVSDTIPTDSTSATDTPESTTIPQTPTNPTIANSFNYVAGTLGADSFTYQSNPNFSLQAFSGNGNYQYGEGASDILDLSGFSSTDVTEFYLAGFDYAAYNAQYNNFFANTTATQNNLGVLFDIDGNGSIPARVFDSIKLNNGDTLNFEGINLVKFANGIIDLSVTPNDPLFDQQWNLQITGVNTAWRFTEGTDDVMIGVGDTGWTPHPDLQNTSVAGDNYIDEYVFSHGTAVQSIIRANTDNGIGMSGINHNSEVMNIDVVVDDSLGGDYTLAQATQAMINRANSQGKRLAINFSLVGGYSLEFEQLIANNPNVMFVIASGNNGSNTLASPADLALNYSNVIAVGASWGPIDWFDNQKTPGTRIDYNSEEQEWWGSTFGSGLTLMAPSEVIAAKATPNASGGHDYDYYINQFNGTSAATPHVTGAISLMLSVNPNLTAVQIKDILWQTAYKNIPGYNVLEYGGGLLNVDAAVRTALALAGNYSAENNV